jgi:DNA-binding response OmpR family regulator
MSRILIVDDDRHVSHAIGRYLTRAGHLVETETNGAVALARVFACPPDLLILNVTLPGTSGPDICRRVRSVSQIPVVMLSARTGEEARIAGFEAGADDYVTKPFSPRELVLRANAVLRRASLGSSRTASSPLKDADLVVDIGARQAWLSGRKLPLTTREFQLLAFFLRHPRTAFTRGQLLSRVWEWNFGDVSTVTVHVGRLREKIETDPGQPTRLLTVWGVGYRYEPAEQRPGMEAEHLHSRAG